MADYKYYHEVIDANTIPSFNVDDIRCHIGTKEPYSNGQYRHNKVCGKSGQADHQKQRTIEKT